LVGIIVAPAWGWVELVRCCLSMRAILDFIFCEDGLREVWSRGLNHSGGGGGGGIKGLLIEFVVHIIVCRPGETVLLT